MRPRRIRLFSATSRWARAVFRRAFPPQERIPWPLIRLACLRAGVDLIAWYDVASQVGSRASLSPVPMALTWTVRQPGSRLLYLFYLAVDDAYRGQGVGSRVLAEVVRRHPGVTIVLDIEPVDDDAPNAQQRRRRLAFYERAGFRDTGYHLTGLSSDYWCLTREAEGHPFNPEEYLEALRYLGVRTTRLRLTRREP